MQIMNIHIIEMPLDYGASRHGAAMGPSDIRLAGLRGTLEAPGHHIVRTLSPMDGTVQEFEEVGNPKAKYLKPIVAANEKLAVEVEKAASAQEFPLVLGGDHSIVLGTLAGLSAAYKKQDLTMGMLYVDAHGDFNTDETTPSGNIHGECVSASCGYGLPELTNLYFDGQKINPENICYVALRDVDPGEKVLMKKAGVTAFTMSDIDRQGFQSVLKQVTSFFKSRVDVIHISFDMDSIDPMFAPGTGVAVPGGLNYREALLLMEEMAQTNMVRSAEIVEVNPILDVRNQTAKMAVELAARLLGKTLF